MVDQDLAHGGRGHGQEMRPTLPLRALLTDQLQVSLVDQSRGLKSVVRPLLLEVMACQCAELLIDYRKQAFGRAGLARRESG